MRSCFMAKTILSFTDKLSDAEALTMAKYWPKSSHNILKKSKLSYLSEKEISSHVLECLWTIHGLLDESPCYQHTYLKHLYSILQHKGTGSS